MQPLNLEVPSDLHLHVTVEEFTAIAAVNRDLKLERTATGELIVNPPTGGESGRINLKIGRYLDEWADYHDVVCFDSSTGFMLPNGATRAPDASLVSRDRWDSLTPAKKEGFVPLCPDFVIELRSKTDSLKVLRNKMREYLDNGTQLGWLIDPQHRTVEVYRSGQKARIFENPDRWSGKAF